MKQIFIRTPFRVLVLLLGLFFSVGAFAQISVKGHVKDAQGEPVIGATVRVVGTQTATVTDFDGIFSIQAPQGANISVTYVGFQTATVKVAPNVEITLKDDAALLENVVVIGYGRAKKSDLTGSVTAIKPDDKNHGLNVNAQDMISGKIAGVSVIAGDGTPGGGAQIRIRGGSSLNASNDPLIVIDGLAMDNYGVQGLANPLSMVNPNDIESFTVLKDASATAIYGSRASNGVIIITTKKGRSGQKPTFNYSCNVSISTKKKTIDVLDGPELMDFIGKLYGTDSDAYKELGYLDANGNKQYANTDWQDQIFRTAVSSDHNLTMSGGLKNMPYRLSLGFTDNEGIIKTSEFKRYTASVSLSPSLLNDHLKLNINGKGMVAKNRYADGVVGAAISMDPTKAVKSDNAIYNEYFGGYVQSFTSASYEGGGSWLYMPKGTSNPVASLDLVDNRATSKSLIGNVEADYAIHGFEDLHLHMNAAMDLSTGKQNTTRSPLSPSAYYYGSDGWNTMDTYNLQLSLYAQYMKDFAKVHHFDIMGGYEWQHFHKTTDWYSHGTVPASNTVNPGAYYNAPADGQVTLYKTENYLVSFFGRLNYSLMDRYMLTFTLRADGSSRFNWLAGNDNQQWGYFPALAFAWRMKDESFLKHARNVPVPGKRHHFPSDGFIHRKPECIAEARLVGKEAGDRFAELFFIVLIVRLIDRLDQHLYGFFIDDVDVLVPRPLIVSRVDDKHTPHSGREVADKLSVLHSVREDHAVRTLVGKCLRPSRSPVSRFRGRRLVARRQCIRRDRIVIRHAHGDNGDQLLLVK